MRFPLSSRSGKRQWSRTAGIAKQLQAAQSPLLTFGYEPRLKGKTEVMVTAHMRTVKEVRTRATCHSVLLFLEESYPSFQLTFWNEFFFFHIWIIVYFKIV